MFTNNNKKMKEEQIMIEETQGIKGDNKNNNENNNTSLEGINNYKKAVREKNDILANTVDIESEGIEGYNFPSSENDEEDESSEEDSETYYVSTVLNHPNNNNTSPNSNNPQQNATNHPNNNNNANENNSNGSNNNANYVQSPVATHQALLTNNRTINATSPSSRFFGALRHSRKHSNRQSDHTNNNNNNLNNNFNNNFNNNPIIVFIIHYIFPLFKITYVLLFLFIIQGMFSLFSSFILLYSSGERLVTQGTNGQKFQMYNFVNHEVTKLTNVTSLMVKHISYEFKSFNLNDKIMLLKLYNYLYTVYGKKIPITSLQYARFDNNYLTFENNIVRVYDPYYKIISTFSLPENIENVFQSRNLVRLDNDFMFEVVNKVPWCQPYMFQNKTEAMWTEVFKNIDDQISISIALPIFVQQNISFIKYMFNNNESGNEDNIKVNLADTDLYPNYKNVDHLFGCVGIQLSIDGIGSFLNRTALDYSSLQIAFIMDRNGTIVAQSGDENDIQNINLIKELSQQVNYRLVREDHSDRSNYGTKNNNTKVKDDEDDDFSIVAFHSFGYKDTQVLYSTIVDMYGLNWTFVVSVYPRSFVQEVFTSGISSVVIFIVVFVTGMVCLILLVQAISLPLHKISRQMMKVVHFRGIDKKLKQSTSLFYDIRKMENSMESLTNAIRVFSKFVPEIIVKKVIRRDSWYGEVGMKYQDMTVLFTDIASFTTIAECTDTQTFLEMMTCYFATICRVMESNSGIIDKFIGDAVMVWFNEDSFPIPDHPVRACRAALESFEAMSELNQQLANKGCKHELKIRIGINSGEMLCGNIGSHQRMNFTVIGENVNIASRLETLNKIYGTKILIGENTYRSVKDVFICYFVDFIAVKGKNTVISIYSIECLRSEASDIQKKICNDLERVNEFMGQHSYQKVIDICERILLYSDLQIAKHLIEKAQCFLL
ncbi:hypothetical protein ABK040_007643 [Willaertia magna]